MALEPATVAGVIAKLTTLRTRGFVWNVRFDHEPLAAALASCGFPFRRFPTHVLHLGDDDYDRAFAQYTATTRNHVRKARRRGVVVTETNCPSDVRAYYQIHVRVVEQKRQRAAYGVVYPLDLLLELITIRRRARLLTAEWDGRIIAGGLFFRHDSSVVYFHGASDRDYSHLFPMCAVFDEAIRRACATATKFVDFGNSNGIASLEQFKSSWGALREFYWAFEWSNPFWERLSQLKGRILW